MTDVPNWAIERALVPFHERHPSATWTPDSIRVNAKADATSGFCALVLAYAAMIAEHEEEPVDALLIEAREICAKSCENINAPPGRLDPATLYRSGDMDISTNLQNVLAALRRGIALARTKSEAGE